MDDWLERAAAALGEPAIAPGELGALLRLTRDVAHAVERRAAPLSAFLVGVAVGRRTAGGGDREAALREAALREAIEAVRATVPEGPAAD